MNDGEILPTITTDELQQKLEAGEKLELVDVTRR